MKTTITVSVRDGWLTKAISEDGTVHGQVRYIVEMYDDYEEECAVVAFYGQDDHWQIEGFRAAEIMEIIRAGKGEIRREVENG